MRRAAAAALTLGILTLVPMSTQAQDLDHVIDESETPTFLFVVSGSSGSVDGDSLTLQDVPAVIYFSDRPARVAGHMAVADFVANWSATADTDSFAFDPPNAVLSVLDEDGPVDIVIELSDADVDGDSLTFAIEVLDGTLPVGPFGSASVFIDDVLQSCASGGPCSGA